MRDDWQEDFVVNDGVEDSSTVSLILLEEETVEQSTLAINRISPLILKKIVLGVK
jgi:hypothetical protein